MSRRDGVRDRARALTVPFIAFVLYSVYALSRYSQLLTAGYDLGIFDQVVRDYSRFRAPLVPLKGDHYNILGDHFHPILALLAPLYWVWDDARVLLLAQAAAIAVSVAIVGAFARRHLSGRWVTLLTIGYAFGWPIQAMVDFDFHEVALAVPLLGWAIDALDRKAWVPFTVACLFLLATREDMGVIVALLGMVALGRGLRPPRTRGLAVAGAAMLVIGPLVYQAVTAWVLPHFSPTGTFAYWSYEALGPDAAGSIEFMVLHPVRTIAIFLTPMQKTETLLLLFAPVLFLCLRSPYVIAVLPLLAQRFFSSRELIWRARFHYNAPAWIILVLAAIDGASRFGPDLGPKLKKALAVTMATVAIVGTVAGLTLFQMRRVVYGLAFRTTPHMVDQRAILVHIPENTCVEADDRLAVHLTHTNRVSLPTIPKGDSDFVALDLSQLEVGFPLPSPHEVAERLDAKGYTVVFSQGAMRLYQRPGYSGPRPECEP